MTDLEFATRGSMRAAFDVPIRMDDGLELRADIFLPLAEGRYPVLMAHGPYGKGMSFQDGHFKPIWEMMTSAHPETAAASSNRYQVWELPDPERWTTAGYACVRVDSRGSGASPGIIDLMSPREIRDYHDCIEWAGVQPWCTGKVGLSGISYYAITQWLVASTQPPHLAAMFAFEGAADFYRDMSRHGGILTNFWQFLTQHQILPLQHGLGLRGYRSKVTGRPVSGAAVFPDEVLDANHRPVFAEQKSREFDDAFYRSRSPDWSKVAVPFLSAGSWGGLGLHLRGNTEAFANAASKEKYLEMHGLEHWTHYYTDYGFNLQKRFFDRYLKGVDNGFDREPPVRLNVRRVGNRFDHRMEDQWPIDRTQWTKFHLDAGAARLGPRQPASAASASYEALGDGFTFLTDPFTEETEITGPAAAHLAISSSTSDADLFLVLRLFAPDLKEAAFLGSQDPLTPVAMGWLRASHRALDPERSLPYRPYHAHRDKQPLEPGAIVACDIEIWPTSIVVPKGFRLGLSVRGRDYVSPAAQPRMITDVGRPQPNGAGAMFHPVGVDRSPEVFGGTVTVHSGPDHPCWIMLPVIPG